MYNLINKLVHGVIINPINPFKTLNVNFKTIIIDNRTDKTSPINIDDWKVIVDGEIFNIGNSIVTITKTVYDNKIKVGLLTDIGKTDSQLIIQDENGNVLTAFNKNSFETIKVQNGIITITIIRKIVLTDNVVPVIPPEPEPEPPVPPIPPTPPVTPTILFRLYDGDSRINGDYYQTDITGEQAIAQGIFNPVFVPLDDEESEEYYRALYNKAITDMIIYTNGNGCYCYTFNYGYSESIYIAQSGCELENNYLIMGYGADNLSTLWNQEELFNYDLWTLGNGVVPPKYISLDGTNYPKLKS